MELDLYKVSLVFMGLLNLVLAGWLLLGSKPYRQYKDYHRTRIAAAIWMIAFALGYFINVSLKLRFVWPSAASALTVTYFHIGVICFSWGFTPLLNHEYLTRRVIIRDLAIFLSAMCCYWTVAATWKNAPLYTALSFIPFFLYGLYAAIVFYRTYNLVSERKIRMKYGNLLGFIRWMQMCCDLIVLFGLGSVAITGIFPLETWPYIALLWVGLAIYVTITLSVERYGKVIIENASV